METRFGFLVVIYPLKNAGFSEVRYTRGPSDFIYQNIIQIFLSVRCERQVNNETSVTPYRTSGGQHGGDGVTAVRVGAGEKGERSVGGRGICVHAKAFGFRVRALYKHRATVSAAVSEQREAEWLSEGAGPRGPHWLLNYIWMERKGCCLATAYTALRQNGEARSIRTPVISLMRVALPRSSLSLPLSSSLFFSVFSPASLSLFAISEVLAAVGIRWLIELSNRCWSIDSANDYWLRSRIRDWIMSTRLAQKFVIFLLTSVVSRITDLSFKDWKTSFSELKKKTLELKAIIFRSMGFTLKSCNFVLNLLGRYTKSLLRQL